ncbi:hypothetical protein BDV19DRAFT_207983 [Aspergillus venezuelensis]
MRYEQGKKSSRLYILYLSSRTLISFVIYPVLWHLQVRCDLPFTLFFFALFDDHRLLACKPGEVFLFCSKIGYLPHGDFGYCGTVTLGRERSRDNMFLASEFTRVGGVLRSFHYCFASATAIASPIHYTHDSHFVNRLIPHSSGSLHQLSCPVLYMTKTLMRSWSGLILGWQSM